MNKIDEYYEEKTTLEEINRKLHNGYPLYVVNVLEGVDPVMIEISLNDVYRSIDKEHFKGICWRLKRMFTNDVRKELSAKVVKELTEELEKKRMEIADDFKINIKEVN